MSITGIKHGVAGLLFLAGTVVTSTAQTTTPPPATQTPPAAAGTPTPATPPAAPSATGKTTDQIPPTEDGTSPGAASPTPGQAGGSDATTTSPTDEGAGPPAEDGANAGQPDASGEDGPDAQDELSIGEIPEIKIVDLTPEKAKASIDTYALLKDKYKEAKLEDYETLQEFVEKDPLGKDFETDVKAAGFSDVEVWNQTITTVSTTYSNLVNDQTAETQAQIAEVEKDTELAKDMKDKLLASLRALIPTDNNRKVVQSLLDDPNYKDKLKLLETEEE